MLKDLETLLSEKENLCFMLIEAEGELYCELEKKLEQLEEEIFVTKEIMEESNEN